MEKRKLFAEKKKKNGEGGKCMKREKLKRTGGRTGIEGFIRGVLLDLKWYSGCVQFMRTR